MIYDLENWHWNFQGLIVFIEGLIAIKISFKVQFEL
jgi:hypothetical protein